MSTLALLLLDHMSSALTIPGVTRRIVENFSANITVSLDRVRLGTGFLDFSFERRALYASLTLSAPNSPNAFLDRFFGEELGDGKLEIFAQMNRDGTSVVTVYAIINDGPCSVWSHFYEPNLPKLLLIPEPDEDNMSNNDNDITVRDHNNSTVVSWLVSPLELKNGVHVCHWNMKWRSSKKISADGTTTNPSNDLLIHVYKSLFDEALVALKVENTPYGTFELATFNVDNVEKKLTKIESARQRQAIINRLDNIVPDRCRTQL